MINTSIFGRELQKLGFSFYTGVPCSFLKNLINYAINECDYTVAANEGDAVAIASGSYLAGRKSVVFMQNSGLTNASSPLVSLNHIFRIPILGFVSLRGEPGVLDEPQHKLMGQITTNMLELMEVEWAYLALNMDAAHQQLMQANEIIESGKSFFFVVHKDTFEDVALHTQELVIHSNEMKVLKSKLDQFPFRSEALRIVNSMKLNNTVQLATTGKTGRELYEIEDAKNNLYMVGSMGCISSLGLGLARNKPNLDVVVIDGDGSLLMHLGSMATNGYYQPSNMLHLVLDNNAHDSTGGQSTVSHNINFVEIAASCGYEKTIYIHNLDELRCAIEHWQMDKGLTFMYMKIAKSPEIPLSRPKKKPHEVKDRLQTFIESTD